MHEDRTKNKKISIKQAEIDYQQVLQIEQNIKLKEV